jgi:DNA modification methylase
LRDYGTAKWEGDDPTCDHVEKATRGDAGRPTCSPRPCLEGKPNETKQQFKSICSKCGARRVDSQLGLEPSFHDYIENMTGVFREVRRVLRKDGTCWVNMGDSYANDTKWGGSTGGKHVDALHGNSGIGRQKVTTGLKAKDLCGIPWRLAFALQADGWYLRSDIIWSKPNPMPESVTDRPTKAHEYLFLLTKSANYYCDMEAIREEVKEGSGIGLRAPKYDGGSGERMKGGPIAQERKSYAEIKGANRRTVWEIATSPFPEAHFATFPPALVEPCIKAGTSEKGCCAKCGAPWVREVERTAMLIDRSERTHEKGRTRSSDTMIEPPTSKTIGWSPSCSCRYGNNYDDGFEFLITPCTVLDLFGGAGTTGLVADRLGRNAILIELNPQYAEMAERRLRDDAGMFAMVAAE